MRVCAWSGAYDVLPLEVLALTETARARGSRPFSTTIFYRPWRFNPRRLARTND